MQTKTASKPSCIMTHKGDDPVIRHAQATFCLKSLLTLHHGVSARVLFVGAVAAAQQHVEVFDYPAT